MGSERVPVLRLNFVTLLTARFLSPRSAHPIAVVIWAYALRDVHASALLLRRKIIVGLSKIGDLPLRTNRSPTGPPLDQKNPVITACFVITVGFRSVQGIAPAGDSSIRLSRTSSDPCLWL